MFSLFGNRKKQAPFVSAVIAAGGSSSRMMGENKLLCEVGDLPVLVHTLLAFQRCQEISEIVMAAKEDMLVEYSNLASSFGITKLTQVIAGGSTRLESVYKAACQTSKEAEYLVVHDAARPLVTVGEITLVCQKAFECSCAAAAAPVKDTIKIVEDGRIIRTVDREKLWAMQTPQAADRDLLIGALQNAVDKGIPVTDECMALEQLGAQPAIVRCSYENIKITTPEDLIFAQAVLEERQY